MVEALFSKVDALGKFITAIVEYIQKMLIVGYGALRSVFIHNSLSRNQMISVVLAQIYYTGVQALPLVTVLALATGSIVLMQSVMNLSLLGGTQIIGNLIVATLVREVTPLLVSLVVIARSGTAVASEVGNMRANREVEALESMGINPLSYIVFPRVVGGVVSVFCLSFYFSLISILGGFLSTKLIQNLSFSFFIDSIMSAFNRHDMWMFIIKNTFSGFIIFVVCCYQGLSVERSPHEVPKVTMDAVVNSIIMVVIFNLAVTALFYLNQLRSLGVL